MAKPSDYPGFRKLLEEWNRRLVESGFRDIETVKHGERVLKQTGTARRYEQLDTITREAKVQFYRRLAKHVHETTFDSEDEKNILVLYAQGYSQAEIKRILRVAGHRCKIYYPIYKYLQMWGLK